ncbi:hypothetical protein F7Q99_34540 [Streptomyces kaniharaensis]|uniref:DUF3562 domain-containing protein n=1 Tax=Streptomyces kaniharaensis TaxID=212423 RepID=A0A6N7KZP2_9ACTN|nr:hypothetical protein [Streptomyces kaniharaensis]MQS17166.1 hypothetical protein [Streptomyces kaniharaensis]
MTWVSPEDEVAMRLAAARLKASHPEADAAIVDTLVVGAYDELRDAKVRTFVPFLTERRARPRLELPSPDARPAPES